MDAMVKMLIKAMGVEPEAFMQRVNQVQAWVVNAIQSFDKRLTASDVRAARIEQMLEKLCNHYGLHENDRHDNAGFERIEHGDGHDHAANDAGNHAA